mmetsp:Transcript_49109/g.92048  ORF Transcript_49109/g.92048 Transcript_49109/m.92048 type:complete len:310 (+) Transcript_49109:83-1012(+)
MSHLEPDSFDVSSVGRQMDSKKETCPAYSFGTSSREVAAMKVFVSPKLTLRAKAGLNSPGPVYDVPTSVGVGPGYAFPQEEQRPHIGGAQYPDSSVDLTCALVDSQKVKFGGPAYVRFGTESRNSHKNAEILVTNPNLMLGKESPGAAEYSPQDKPIVRQQPKYSFGPVEERVPFSKTTPRLMLPATGTPRTVGPASHRMPAGIGRQPQSARRSSPAWSISGSVMPSKYDEGPMLDTAPQYSCLGKQVVSTSKTSANCAFGKSTREKRTRMAMCMTQPDRGPAGDMVKQRFHADLPKTALAPAAKRYGL